MKESEGSSNESISHESIDAGIKEARERLRITLSKFAKPKGGDRASKSWSWLWLPLVVCYFSLGILTFLFSIPMPPKLVGMFLLLAATTMFIAWERGCATIRARRHLRYAINRHLRQVDLLVEQAAEVSKKASAAADVRHASNRKRQKNAKEFYQSRPWETQADAARAIADSFNVTEKVAARWVAKWKKEGNPAPQGETPYGEE